MPNDNEFLPDEVLPDDDLTFPGSPDPAELRKAIIESGGPRHWRPFGGAPNDLSGVPADTAEKVLSARLKAGPGPGGNAYQWALFDYHAKLAELDSEEEALLSRMTAAKGFNAQTGEPIFRENEATVTALSFELSRIVADRKRLLGEHGKSKLDKAADKAVAAEMRLRRSAYVEAEAQRRARANVVEDEIERRAAGYRKTMPR